VTLAGTDHLVADYKAHNLAARIEGGYRYALPSQPYWQGRSGLTPYAAAQVQLTRTPSYSETAASGSAVFALAYESRTTTTARTEFGAWYDWSASINHDTFMSVRARLAWAHDFWSSPDVTASFVALPGSSFVVRGAEPDSDLLLASVSAETSFRNGYSFAARLDGEFADNTQKYSATGRLRYRW
jgi:outer membrane autotransporter protein